MADPLLERFQRLAGRSTQKASAPTPRCSAAEDERQLMNRLELISPPSAPILTAEQLAARMQALRPAVGAPLSEGELNARLGALRPEGRPVGEAELAARLADLTPARPANWQPAPPQPPNTCALGAAWLPTPSGGAECDPVEALLARVQAEVDFERAHPGAALGPAPPEAHPGQGHPHRKRPSRSGEPSRHTAAASPSSPTSSPSSPSSPAPGEDDSTTTSATSTASSGTEGEEGGRRARPKGKSGPSRSRRR
ncbi:hypothetical protein PAPYR_445 [Paratrimastix pyriformis]|uniref:Uncharacterized protein n=1 Tax=Paratrimastix pyriformis TaxID=342808 RepID=A0ABQ8UWB2_9EUKA|nr:hypothetical protein PAPYR_445 [Paratrimastix pyriformis]